MNQNKKKLFNKDSNFDDLNPLQQRESIRDTVKTGIKQAQDTKDHLEQTYDRIKNDPTKAALALTLNDEAKKIQENIDKSLNLLKMPDISNPNQAILLGALLMGLIMLTK